MDVYGNITSQGHNFIGKTNASAGWVASDFAGSAASPLNALLGPLQNNGGLTATMLPTQLSAVIDLGDDSALGPPLNLTTDQRGFPRKLGAHIDIGAAEADPAQVGANFLVTTTDDHNDGVAGTVDCTLREAIIAANANADANTITFASNVTGVITLRLGELAISHDLTILGPGAMALAISGNTNNRVFNVSAGSVLISGLAITNGRVVGAAGVTGSTPGGAGGAGGSALGGGIYSQTSLTVSNCWITGNSALGGNGGVGGADDNNNQAGMGGTGGSGTGGGIYSTGSLTLANCTISDNTAAGGVGGRGPDAVNYFFGDAGLGGAGGAGAGGGVANAGIINAVNCTLARNSANGGNGGAGGNSQPDQDGAVGGPGGNGAGGGLANLSSLALASCTLSTNTVHGGAGGLGGLGGGRGANGADGSPGTAQGGGLQSTTTFNVVQNSLIAGNNASNGPDCFGTFTSQGYNLIGNVTGATGFTSTADQVGSSGSPLDPLLGPPKYYGGPAPTMALLSGSPAIDKGNRGVLGADQRGVPRPFDFSSIPNANGGDGSDIGAFELNPPTLNITRSANNVILSWSTNDTGYTLETKTNLDSSLIWSAVPGTPPVVGGQYTFTNSAATGNKFYRLKQ
jgi:CSLREA domain-containing protein